VGLTLGRLLLVLALALPIVGAAAAPAGAAEVPHIKHLFVIVLENEDAESTFGATPPVPYLGTTMREAGAYIPNYYGIGHQSLDNYLAMISGQPPNLATQSDCLLYGEMVPLMTEANGVAVGQGCVFPRSVGTIANQLELASHSWHGYMEDIANSTDSGEPATCRHPKIGGYDGTQVAEEHDQYAARHDPFVYFHSITDFQTCQRNVVDLSRLPEDLRSEASTPEYSFVSPDLCADGHDATCAEPGTAGGDAGIDAFLREWVPRIEASPAYQDHGAIFVSFDESETKAESCCNEPVGPNTLNNGGSMPGNGGGRIGAVVLSPCTVPGTVTQVPYNHYSFLRWSEDNWGLAHLADASATGLEPFGADVFDSPACDGRAGGGREVGAGGGGGADGARLVVRPRHALAGRERIFRFHLIEPQASCRRAQLRFDGLRARTNGRGRATLKLRPRQPGRLVAVASPRGCATVRAAVRISARR
jgi:hypothetical protein